MSNSKKQAREARHRNYSFSSSHQQHYQGTERERLPREPLKETDIIRNYSPSRFQNDPLMKLPLYNTSLEPVSPSLVALHQEDEIRKLEEVIYYLTGDRDMLKEECGALHAEIGALAVNFSREKESYEAQIRKLKQIIKDKESECESIGKALKKQKQIFEQQNQRMNYQLKSTIEKKTDEIYAISREKQMENQQIRKTLEAIIEELKATHKKELTQKDHIIPPLKAQIAQWKLKYENLQKQIASIDQRYESQKLKTIEENELFVGDLKDGYHRTKVQIMQASKQVVQALQENSQIQRSAFLIEIDHLRQTLVRCQKENQELHSIIFEANRAHDEQINGYIDLISELQSKLEVVHRQKQKEIQFLKIKAANLHKADLQAAQSLFKVKLARHIEQLVAVEADKKRLVDIIEEERTKNKNLIYQLKEKDSRFYQELFTIRFKNSQNFEELKRIFEKQKEAIIHQNLHTKKETQSAASRIQFQDQQLKKLRKLFEGKTKQIDDLEKEIIRLKGQIKDQKVRHADEMSAREKQWTQQREKFHQQIASKNKEIQRTNNSLLEAVQSQQNNHSAELENQIRGLREKLKTKIQQGKSWKDKAEALNATIDQLSSQKQRLKAEIQKDSKEVQALWEQKCKDKIKDIEKFYQRKIQFLLLEKQQLQAQGQQQVHSYHELKRKYEQIDSNLQQLVSAIHRRTDLQEKVVKLGLDRNLVKNKQQLFEY